MRTRMGVKRIVKPKFEMPKTTIKKVTQYKITAGPDGKPVMAKNEFKKVIRNVKKG